MKTSILSTMNEAITFWNTYIALCLVHFYLNVSHEWVAMSVLFKLLYFPIRKLETLALTAITKDVVFLIPLDQRDI